MDIFETQETIIGTYVQISSAIGIVTQEKVLYNNKTSHDNQLKGKNNVKTYF